MKFEGSDYLAPTRIIVLCCYWAKLQYFFLNPVFKGGP